MCVLAIVASFVLICSFPFITTAVGAKLLGIERTDSGAGMLALLFGSIIIEVVILVELSAKML